MRRRFTITLLFFAACGGSPSSGSADATDEGTSEVDAEADAESFDAQSAIDAATNDGANDTAPDALAATTCVDGGTCSPGTTCGTYDGLVATACVCSQAGQYGCGQTGAPPPCPPVPPNPPPPCTSPYETQCVNAQSGCFMVACYQYGGTWSGECTLSCPSTPPPCGGGCGAPNQSCTCSKNGSPTPCTCFDLGNGQGDSLWLCQ